MQAPAIQDSQTYTVSAFFEAEQAVEDVIQRLVEQGVPRDLIDVVVSRQAMNKFFPGKARPYRDSVFSFAGRGALTGLLSMAIVTLVITFTPGYEPAGLMAHVQLAGPNVGTIVGATLGALYGLMRKSHPKPQHYRALERDDALLLLVHLQDRPHAEALSPLLTRHGASDVRLEGDNLTAVGAE